MTAPKTKRARSKCCADPDCECGLRNRYFFGKQLSPYSFQVEQRYALERRRLLNRTIHGWGVVYGFEIAKTSSGSLTIKPGLALDQNGRELLQVEELTHAANELIVRDENGKQSTWRTISASECWLLSAHYAEQDTDAVKVGDPCQCEHMECNYTCETIRFSLQRTDHATCCDRCRVRLRAARARPASGNRHAGLQDGATSLTTPASAVAAAPYAITSPGCRQVPSATNCAR